jgi:hypothetical protein
MSRENIPGRSAYLWIYDRFIATAPRDAVVVEVGVALGKSISYIARKCIDAGRDDIRIVAVDPWVGTARNGEQQASGPPSLDGDFELFKRTMLEHAPDELKRIEIMRRPSVVAAHYFPKRSIDLVVLDAAHDYASVRDDITAWLPNVKPDGMIGGDDYMPEYQGVIDAVLEAFPAAGGFVVEERYDQSWGTWLVELARREPFDDMKPADEPAVP